MSRDTSAMKNAKFLIYSKFESFVELKSTIAGSLLIDSALTEEEAKEKISIYQERSAKCASRGHSSYVYIDNQPEWWR